MRVFVQAKRMRKYEQLLGQVSELRGETQDFLAAVRAVANPVDTKAAIALQGRLDPLCVLRPLDVSTTVACAVCASVTLLAFVVYGCVVLYVWCVCVGCACTHAPTSPSPPPPSLHPPPSRCLMDYPSFPLCVCARACVCSTTLRPATVGHAAHHFGASCHEVPLAVLADTPGPARYAVGVYVDASEATPGAEAGTALTAVRAHRVERGFGGEQRMRVKVEEGPGPSYLPPYVFLLRACPSACVRACARVYALACEGGGVGDLFVCMLGRLRVPECMSEMCVCVPMVTGVGCVRGVCWGWGT
jgi:hypothetical protein